MSAKKLDIARKAALALPDSQRAELARDLVASLDGPADLDAQAAWDIEICRRINEIEAGTAELLDADKVMARARKRLNDTK